MPKDQAYLKAEQKIAEALQSRATSLSLSTMQLTELPESIGQLTQLTELNLSGNQLTTLPDSLGQLTGLVELNLSDNQISDLPSSFKNLIFLKTLRFSGGGGRNPLGNLPEVLRGLKQLERLWAEQCELISLPDWIGDLVNLQDLQLYENRIVDLPLSFLRLDHLIGLKLKYNPLNPALRSAYEQGLDAVKAYLRSLEQNAEPLYEAKLVLVGEGSVGKTTLLKALKGSRTADDGPRQNEPTTHGVEIDIHGLKLPHPEKDGVEIQLNAWDFGGQDVYRVTHQFFFSRRSLYLLVWEPRRGVQQGQVEDWLNMIRLRVGDEARVIIVSTHCKTGARIARIDQPVFKQQYGDMIVGFHEVDSLVYDEATDEMVGIAELKRVIATEVSKFNHVGMLFNSDWKNARDELIARSESFISYSIFAETCARHRLSEIDTTTLAGILNDLGYMNWCKQSSTPFITEEEQ